MATLSISPTNPTLDLAGSQGQIVLNYVVNDPDSSFDDTAIASAGIEIYFDSTQIQIDQDDIIVPSTVGTVPPIGGRILGSDDGNGDADANTGDFVLLTFQPLTVSETETQFITIPFSTTAAFNGDTQVNFIGRTTNPAVPANAITPVTVQEVAPTLVITPLVSTVADGEITLNYRLDNFTDTQISSAAIEIYFDSTEIQIDPSAIIVPDGVGTVPEPAGIILGSDTNDADGNASTDSFVLVTFQPLNSSDENTVLITIPFSRTDDFADDTQVNFIGRDSNPNLTTLEIASVTVLPNEPPVITSTAFTIAENTATVGTIAATDPENEAITFALVATSVDASLFTIDANGALSFIAAPDFEAPADNGGNNVYNLQVEVSDGTNTVTQDVTVTVTDVNEAPIAQDDTASLDLQEASSVTIRPLDNDSDPDGDDLAIDSVTDPENGTVTIEGETLLYTPNSGFTGTDTFTYTISDGENLVTANINVNVSGTPGNLELTPSIDTTDTEIESGLVFDPSGNGNLILDATRESQSDLVQNVTNGTDAVFDNLVGLYEVLDAQGSVRDAEGNILTPGTDGFDPSEYALAALTTARENLNFTLRAGASRKTAEQIGDVLLNGGSFYAPFVIANGGAIGVEDFITAESAETSVFNNAAETPSDAVAYFSFIDANPDEVAHLKSYGNGVFGFEDLPGNLGISDNDFNDAVFAFNLTAA